MLQPNVKTLGHGTYLEVLTNSVYQVAPWCFALPNTLMRVLLFFTTLASCHLRTFCYGDKTHEITPTTSKFVQQKLKICPAKAQNFLAKLRHFDLLRCKQRQKNYGTFINLKRCVHSQPRLTIRADDHYYCSQQQI